MLLKKDALNYNYFFFYFFTNLHINCTLTKPRAFDRREARAWPSRRVAVKIWI
jgi:hypothetical protein